MCKAYGLQNWEDQAQLLHVLRSIESKIKQNESN
jgi:hypothetical protein